MIEWSQILDPESWDIADNTLSEDSLQRAVAALSRAERLTITPTKLIVHPKFHRIALFILFPSLRNRRAYLRKRRGIFRRK